MKKKMLGEKKQWGKECRVRKKELRKFLRKVKKDKNLLEEQKIERRQYRILCENRKEKYRKNQENIKSETEAWKYINIERRRRISISITQE